MPSLSQKHKASDVTYRMSEKNHYNERGEVPFERASLKKKEKKIPQVTQSISPLNFEVMKHVLN